MLCLLSIDPALGRLDYDSLSDQTLMEMLVDCFHSRDLHDENGYFKDVCEWSIGYLSIVKCKNDRVDSIDFDRWHFDGKQFEFGFIPPLVKSFKSYKCELQGTLDTSHLPISLIQLNVSYNALFGTINFKTFPRDLEIIVIEMNLFSGNVVLSDLPDSVVLFNADRNDFSGQIVLQILPAAMQRLSLARNKLSGLITIDSTHSSIEEINLYGNSFWGDVRLLVLPPKLNHVNVDENYDLNGTVVLPKFLSELYFQLCFNDIQAVHDESGHRHACEDVILASRYLRRCW